MTSDTLVPAPQSFRIGNSLVISRPPAARIAIVFQDFAAGGTERIMVRLANEWARSRDVMILCGSEQGPARALVSPDVAVLELSPAVPRSPISRWKIGRRMRPLLNAWRPDVIVGPGNHVLPIFMASGPLVAPIVCKLSNPIDLGDPPFVPPALLAAARRKACRPLARIVAMSPALRAEAADYLNTNRVTVISEPILSDFSRAKRRRRPAGMRVIFAGRLVAQKNVALALRTMAALPDDFSLTIVGDGPDRGRLEAMARRLKLTDRVAFTGLVPDIRPHLEASDLFLLPSRFEGYPAVMIEALAAGLPVVATPSSPAMAEILIDRSFGRIAAADPIALATAIMAYEGSDGPDPERLRPLLDQHLLPTCASRWLEQLDAVAAERKRCPR
jgi:glycosyltransferase involved in cell wall biosynthesis